MTVFTTRYIRISSLLLCNTAAHTVALRFLPVLSVLPRAASYAAFILAMLAFDATAWSTMGFG